MNTAILSSAEVAPPSSETKINSPRFHELDSMRGLAAIVVLFHHFTYMFYPEVFTGTGPKDLLLSPLISGNESVRFFFLLSGFVLALPLLRGKGQPYFVYIQRRLLRIYGPYLGALVLSLVGCALWHNKLGSTGWASCTWFEPVRAKPVLDHIIFIGNYNYGQFNTAFWSLVYEMRISIIFPLLFLVAQKLRARYVLVVIAALTQIGMTQSHYKTMISFEYAGIFLLGALLAKHLSSIKSFYQKAGVTQRCGFVIASSLLYICGHRLMDIGPMWHFGDMPVVVGAAGLLIIGLNSGRAGRLLNSAVPAFLGRISYSLYLVHGTVLFAMAATLKDRISHLAFFLLFITTSIFLSWAFYVTVENPFMLMSRQAGRTKPLPSALQDVIPARTTESGLESTISA